MILQPRNQEKASDSPQILWIWSVFWEVLYAECRNNPQGKAPGLLISFHIMSAVELGHMLSLIPSPF